MPKEGISGPTPQYDGLLVVWEVDAGEHGAGGVTSDEVVAEKTRLDALEAFPSGRGRVRYARLSFVHVGYVYGTTLVSAHRGGGVTVTMAGDAWEYRAVIDSRPSLEGVQWTT
ncbi:hypothetical protein C1I98_21420 [Spongiactinospora gelatinilytica]|uniref:Uncharacterized protein n=1 Tax=Spongiactinospora gelatinilytica TaxID=2666298 RepID=A0A2W2FV85_9ACTN|nr:hypothetical protein C1I98_21420 [Spongiactinospora gelatinilytica]